MIQRIQTIFLVAIIGCLGVALTMPLVHLQVDGQILDMTAFSVKANGETLISTFWIAITLIVTMFIAIVSILKFKNRLLQIKLGALISLLCAVSVGLVFYFRGMYPAKLSVGTFSIMLALVFNFLANWFIRRDQKLVQDSDRLR